MELSGIIAHGVIFLSRAHCRKRQREWQNIRKNTSRIRNHVLHGHVREFTSFSAFLELRNTLPPDDLYEKSTDYGSRKSRKDNEVSIGADFQITYFCVILIETIIQIRGNLSEMSLPWWHMPLHCCCCWTTILYAIRRMISHHDFTLLGAQNCCRVSYPHKISRWRGLLFRGWQKLRLY